MTIHGASTYGTNKPAGKGFIIAALGVAFVASVAAGLASWQTGERGGETAVVTSASRPVSVTSEDRPGYMGGVAETARVQGDLAAAAEREQSMGGVAERISIQGGSVITPSVATLDGADTMGGVAESLRLRGEVGGAR